MIKATGLKKVFGNTVAVDGVSFEVKKGEIVGFLGPNGAGKTTTMRMLTGYLAADEGKVEINGLDVDEAGVEVKRLVGYLPENNPLYREMLVGEFLEMSGRLKGLGKTELKRELDFVVAAVVIGDVYYRPIRELSKGYKQRVGMAAALMADPQVVIMDEPTEGLDPNQRSEIRSLIRNLARKRTIILSTHVMGEVQALVSRVLVINRGKMVADGTIDQLERGGARRLEVEIEGRKVKTLLAKLQGVEVAESRRLGRGRVAVVLQTTGRKRAQPEISRLAVENKWVIWKLVEERKGLEEVFRELTKN